ncbi:MAG: elongation factor P [Verrucomicrobia bacterium]|nr:elongation factor P [Verrucomicrobiota bacterium]
MPSANDLRKGMAIKYNNDICIVLETQHRTPGNLRAFVQASLRSLKSGRTSDVRFSSTEKVEVVSKETKKMEYSYKDQTGYHFSDPQTYEETVLQDDLVGHAKDFLVENMTVDVTFVEGKAAQVELPPTVELKITESADGIKGDSASNVMKPATVETGLVVQVPLFIKEGEKIKVRTSDGAYMSRA